MSKELIAKARTWERDWGERRTSGLITELADLAESEGRRADRLETALAEVENGRAAAIAEIFRLKGQQP